jgi:predicted patatin/cPLA2 family phospholipase
MDYKILMKVQEQQDEYKDTWKAIKDLEAELDYMYMREPDDVKYIMSIERQIDKLYEKLDTLSDENN